VQRQHKFSNTQLDQQGNQPLYHFTGVFDKVVVDLVSPVVATSTTTPTSFFSGID